ncbi:MAG: type II secretion system protein [Planctomycetes bacterium]|nr:type II secretion system protein [Planctomycetota bacterium]
MSGRRIRTCGFTLAEMLTVIAIIGILAGLVLSVLPKVQDRAERAVCMNTLRQIGLAMETYTADYHGRYPTLNGPKALQSVADNPWYYALKQYGIEAKSLTCPSDENFDPDRYPDEANLTNRLVYRSNSISYGIQYDFKDGDGNPYEALLTGGWAGKTPDGIPDTLSVGDLIRKGETIIAADSDGDGILDYAIDLTGLRRIGGRHKGYANVLFADIHVEAKQVMPEKGNDINTEYNYWTLAND